jgi:hypothetical protein
MGLFSGRPERFDQISMLTPEQQALQSNRIGALQAPGAGGAFGGVADAYRDYLDPNGQAYQSFAAPYQRQYNEEIIPGLAEQFAGMGSGALSSSGFSNSAAREGTNLTERLAALRANLRMQGAQGLSMLGQQSLTPTVENIHRPATQGFLPQFLQGAAPGIGMALGSALGPLGSLAGAGLSSLWSRLNQNPNLENRGSGGARGTGY